MTDIIDTRELPRGSAIFLHEAGKDGHRAITARTTDGSTFEIGRIVVINDGPHLQVPVYGWLDAALAVDALRAVASLIEQYGADGRIKEEDEENTDEGASS